MLLNKRATAFAVGFLNNGNGRAPFTILRNVAFTYVILL